MRSRRPAAEVLYATHVDADRMDDRRLGFLIVFLIRIILVIVASSIVASAGGGDRLSRWRATACARSRNANVHFHRGRWSKTYPGPTHLFGFAAANRASQAPASAEDAIER
jgi:hypothetical protein